MASDNLYLRAGELLAYSTNVLPGISRAYVALASPALDCPDQLTVHVSGLARQAAGGSIPLADYGRGLATQIATVNTCTFVVTLVRCVPTASDAGTPPSTLDYEASSLALLGDLWLLWKAIPQGVRDGLLWQGCEQLVLGPALPIPESGGFAGWQVTVAGEVLDG